MDSLSGEYNVKVVNGEFELPPCFGQWFQQFSSTNLILFKVDQRDQELGMDGTWIMTDTEEENNLRKTMHLPENLIRISKPLSSPWKIALPSEVAHGMGFKQQDTLVLVGMYEKIEICTYEEHLLNVKRFEASLLKGI